MRIISGPTISSTIRNAFVEVLKDGEVQPTRNGYAKALYDTTFEIRNPRSRHLHLQGRKSNIFQLIAETFWVMAGANAVQPYLSYFLPRAINYSDDGVVWHGAYGPRMYMYEQLQGAIKLFQADKLTRRAYVSIQMPELDSQPAFDKLYGEGHVSKDVPCNQLIQFYVIEGNKFVTKVIQRSGDLLFGTGSINPFEFSFLHELVYNEVRKYHPDLELGPYRWHVTNAHIYSDFEDQAVAVISQEQPFITEHNDMLLVAPPADKWQEFFGEIIAHLGSVIDVPGKSKADFNDDIVSLVDIFQRYNVPVTHNLLYRYAEVLVFYIYGKAAATPAEFVGPEYDLTGLDAEVAVALYSSPFRKFPTVVAQ